MNTACNGIVLVRCAQLYSVPHHSSGQGLLAGLLGSNAELVILCAVIQVDFQTIGRHILPVIAVLILYFAVLTAKVDFTLAGIILGVNLYGKVLAFAFLDDGIFQALNGHSGVDTIRNVILPVPFAQFHSIPFHSCGQHLVTGIFRCNAEFIIFIVTAQIDF